MWLKNIKLFILLNFPALVLKSSLINLLIPQSNFLLIYDWLFSLGLDNFKNTPFFRIQALTIIGMLKIWNKNYKYRYIN
jgi:hypothetical protein